MNPGYEGAAESKCLEGLSPRPALGSPQSRAAARALLERQFVSRRRIDIVSSIPRPGGDGGIHIGDWIECDDGSLFRFSNLPPGMTIEEAERIVAQPGWKPTSPCPEPERIRPPAQTGMVSNRGDKMWFYRSNGLVSCVVSRK
jgi:hypothetical protein